MYWKNSIDEVAVFLDGGKIPCLLIESRADLVDEDENEKKQLEEFASKYEFCGAFRTSAKTGLNINEFIEFLINNILQRIEDMESKANEPFSTERKSISLSVAIDQKDVKKISKNYSQTKNIKCSFKEHKDIEDISYCFKCNVYLCDKCEDYHKGLLENHKINDLDSITDQICTGLCNEENHNNIKLEYFCKNHNQLCCGLCISKIKGNGNGQHNDCDVCLIQDIKKEKESKLKDNINILEDFTEEYEDSIINLKNNFEKVTEKKKKLKTEIKEIFTKIKKEIKDREDFLLSEVDKYIDNNYCNEEIIKKIELIGTSLEKGKSIENEWENDDKLNVLINDCINIENNSKYIDIIKKILINLVKIRNLD